MELEESTCLTSDYTTKPQSSRQYGIGTKTAITRQSGWLLSKSLQAINAGEGVEKREPSYTIGGNAN